MKNERSKQLSVVGYVRHVDRVTVASVKIEGVVNQAGRPRWFRAAAIQHPEDDHDSEIARLLSFGRALQRAGAYMVKQAQGRIKHADQQRRSSERSWEKAREDFRRSLLLPAWVTKNVREDDVLGMERSGDQELISINGYVVAQRRGGQEWSATLVGKAWSGYREEESGVDSTPGMP